MKQDNAGKKELETLLDRLTPLDAGIVFGKEDAWLHLQQQLDTRRRRVNWLWSLPLAAALALVLLLVNPGKQDKDPLQASTLPEKVVKDTTPALTPYLQAASPAREVRQPVIVNRQQLHTANIPGEAHSKDAIVGNEQEDKPTDVVPTATPKMKVVHVNSLESDAEEPLEAEHIRLSELPVVHLNELKNDEIPWLAPHNKLKLAEHFAVLNIWNRNTE